MSQHVAGERPNLSTAGHRSPGHPSRLPDLAGRPRRSGGLREPTADAGGSRPRRRQAAARPGPCSPPVGGHQAGRNWSRNTAAISAAGAGTPVDAPLPMTNSHRVVDEHLRHHPLSALTMEALQLWHSLGLRQLRRPCRPDSANRDVSSVGREAGPAAYRVAPGDPNRSPEPDGVRAPSRTTTVSSGGPDRLRTCTSVV